MLPRRGRIAFALLIAVALGCVGLASAASLGGIGPQELGAGNSVVTACDSDGVGLSYTTSGGTVQSVTVTGIAGGCVSGSLRVVLANSTGTDIAQGGPLSVSGASEIVTLSPQPSAAAVAAAHISIVGP